ncbi:hypothetical protein L1049_015818 [Liquidambar formosana]|uniref:Uncharacterized protein n=1 Tax=Liquidambar formosana TaxID=63359 RepID=A0AAP0RZL5_LIQFO
MRKFAVLRFLDGEWGGRRFKWAVVFVPEVFGAFLHEPISGGLDVAFGVGFAGSLDRIWVRRREALGRCPEALGIDPSSDLKLVARKDGEREQGGVRMSSGTVTWICLREGRKGSMGNEP